MGIPQLPNEDERAEARRLYGEDPADYDAGRPDYPEQVYRILTARCGLARGARVLEIGAGSGRVTRRLVELGAVVQAVEPDPVLAAHLRDELAGPGVTVVEGSFEEAPLPEGAFDLAVAPMSFHWVDPEAGLPKLGFVVRRGGFAALWWTMFYDPTRPDSLQGAIDQLVGGSGGESNGRPFELDIAGWESALGIEAGLVDVRAEFIPWAATLDLAQLRALYASMIDVRRRPEAEREALLDEVVAIARRELGEVVERPFVTTVYTARRP